METRDLIKLIDAIDSNITHCKQAYEACKRWASDATMPEDKKKWEDIQTYNFGKMLAYEDIKQRLEELM